MTFQQTIIVGNLGRDPEMRYTPSGQAVTNLSIAVDESYTNNNGEKVKKTTWFKVETWGKQAENCNQYLKKGRSVLVEGRLKADEKGNPRTFTRNDGSAGAQFELTADSVRFLRGNDERNGESNGAREEAPAIEETIPFDLE